MKSCKECFRRENEQIKMARDDLSNRTAEFQASFEYGKALWKIFQELLGKNPDEELTETPNSAI